MIKRDRPPKEPFTESEAAAALDITITRLHQLLDEHIFTQGSVRPGSLEFTSNDLLLLSYWNRSSELPQAAPRVLQMPRRK